MMGKLLSSTRILEVTGKCCRGGNSVCIDYTNIVSFCGIVDVYLEAEWLPFFVTNRKKIKRFVVISKKINKNAKL